MGLRLGQQRGPSDTHRPGTVPRPLGARTSNPCCVPSISAEGADCSQILSGTRSEFPAQYTPRNPGSEKGIFPLPPPEQRFNERWERSGAEGNAARKSHQLWGKGVASTKAGGHPHGT